MKSGRPVITRTAMPAPQIPMKKEGQLMTSIASVAAVEVLRVRMMDAAFMLALGVEKGTASPQDLAEFREAKAAFDAGLDAALTA